MVQALRIIWVSNEPTTNLEPGHLCLYRENEELGFPLKPGCLTPKIFNETVVECDGSYEGRTRVRPYLKPKLSPTFGGSCGINGNPQGWNTVPPGTLYEVKVEIVEEPDSAP